MQEAEVASYQVATDLHNTEILTARFHRQRFNRHVHEGYCIGVIEQGAQRFWRSGSNHIAARNSIILVNADQVHDGHRASENGWAYQACYPTVDVFSALSQEFAGPENAPWFEHAVEHDNHMAELLRKMFNTLRESTNTLQRETAFYITMTQLLRNFGKRRPELTHLQHQPVAVRFVADYLQQHFADNISLEHLAALVHLNPFYLVRLFTRTTGLPPHRYQIQVRIQRAKAMLRQKKPLKTIALDCGFSDQSHLNRHFKFVTGITPGQYQHSITL
ncbi:helix-turn-helix domain-containing protein [Gynuella sp.]|uniref:helix-turn-helix domain-containing protein n=1 Tax=Gynuella sp. TaxID=2969146 RepID=UPI003D0F4910